VSRGYGYDVATVRDTRPREEWDGPPPRQPVPANQNLAVAEM